MTTRQASLTRTTRETTTTVTLSLDGTGEASIATGIGMLDHLFATFARFARIDLALACTGDLQVDDHHTAEDCSLVVGEAVNRALGDRAGIARFGWATAPLDESLARVALDLSGRPLALVALGLARDSVGGLAAENVTHLFRSLATAARMSLHVDVLRGDNDHHRAEAAFKAFALALRQAVALDGSDSIPSAKGVL